jgi:hypothetical protein
MVRHRRKPRRAITTEEAARAAEALAEELAPRAQRDRGIVEQTQWRDPEDNNVLRKEARLISGYRRVDELRRLHERGQVTEKQLQAAEKFLIDYEISDGARPAYSVSGVHVDAAASGPNDVQMLAARRYREATQAIGKHASAVLFVAVMGNLNMHALSERFRVPDYVALGWLQAALERLVEHYGM